MDIKQLSRYGTLTIKSNYMINIYVLLQENSFSYRMNRLFFRTENEKLFWPSFEAGESLGQTHEKLMNVNNYIGSETHTPILGSYRI